MTAVAIDWRRPSTTYDDGRVPMYCAIVEVRNGQALTACRGSMAESDGYVSATSTTTDARRCRACLRACGEQSFVDFAAGVPPFPTSLIATSFNDLPALVDHEIERLQQMAAPAMPRTTAVDLPFDVSDELATGDGE